MAKKKQQWQSLTLQVEICGVATGDLVDALSEVKRLVAEGYLSGSNSNDTGRFSFDITNEEG